jgi:transcription-repair coupling factor (superfamily II helicase)
VRLLPAREFPMDEAAHRFRGASARPSRATRPAARTSDVSNGIAPAGIEYYLPLFFDETATLFDYLPDSSDPAAPRRAGRHRGLLEGRPQPPPAAGRRQDRPILAPDQLFRRMRPSSP